jgi:phosphatidylglycerol:prolipoprotein diacylglycerol transferase
VHPVLFHLGSVFIPTYGALAAAGVMLALFLAQRTARIVAVDPGQIWNLCVIALFTALAGERILLVIANFGILRIHPSWLLGLAMVHHPLLAGVGALVGGASAWLYARWQTLSVFTVADALAAPLALGLAFEQLGALMAGSGYGTDAAARLPWAVVYTSPFAARWSGTPLGIPLHPAQAYAALAFFTLAIFLLVFLPVRRKPGDLAGLCLMGLGVAIYFTERWRDTEGRGLLLGGALDGPQLCAIGLLLAGAWVLIEKKKSGAPAETSGKGATEVHP